MKNGATLITEKRERHTKKGYNYDHDTEHTYMDFINAAKAYMYCDPYSWPFDRQSFVTRGTIDDLVNAGAMIATAIDRLQRYEVGKIYKVDCEYQVGTFKVLKVKMSKRTGGVWITFTGLSGDLAEDKQTFIIGSHFDECVTPVAS